MSCCVESWHLLYFLVFAWFGVFVVCETFFLCGHLSLTDLGRSCLFCGMGVFCSDTGVFFVLWALLVCLGSIIGLFASFGCAVLILISFSVTHVLIVHF